VTAGMGSCFQRERSPVKNSCVINYPQAESGIPDPAPFRIVLTDTVSVKLAGNARTGRRGQDLIVLLAQSERPDWYRFEKRLVPRA